MCNTSLMSAMKDESDEGRKYGEGPVPSLLGRGDLSETLAATQNKCNVSGLAGWLTRPRPQC